MRISSVGWMFDDIKELKKASKIITEVTHNHKEGIKGAEVTATIIYLARHGASKEEIKKYASKYYDLDFDYEELKRTYIHGDEICQVTVPEAIYCFLISSSFEDCLRTTISIGGDCDTTAAISCAIAEAFYKSMPDCIVNEALKRIPKDMIKILKEFDACINMK